MKLRAVLGLALLLSLFAAAGLSSAPALHGLIHPAKSHECAATLFASGSCEQVSPPAVVVPGPVWRERFHLFAREIVSKASAPCSILEHAPPAAG